jgi:hypothetical protein
MVYGLGVYYRANLYLYIIQALLSIDMLESEVVQKILMQIIYI